MHHLSSEMKSCIEACLRCYSVCFGTAMTHCLEAGGKHTEPKHFRLMMACAEICRSAAHLMLINTELHKRTCRECADICEACAKDCEAIGGMDECVAECRRCAEICSRMAG